jgi:putative ABC transport system ATP-binding protein
MTTMSEPAYRPVAELTSVSKVYRAGKLDVPALKGISLAIQRERFSMLVGPSGSGKTTLLNLIGCIDRPSEGAVQVEGEDVAALSDNALSDFRARMLGFIFQNFSLIPVLSAYENIEYPLMLLGQPARLRRERTMAMLEAVGLIDQRHQRPNQLSGGQKQRVAIGRALVKDPALVLADEPTANLDSQTGATIIALMRQMQQSHATTFVFSTHDPQLMSHADQTFTIRDGQLVEPLPRASQC